MIYIANLTSRLKQVFIDTFHLLLTGQLYFCFNNICNEKEKQNISLWIVWPLCVKWDYYSSYVSVSISD